MSILVRRTVTRSTPPPVARPRTILARVDTVTDINVNAEATTHGVVAGDCTVSIGSTDTAPALAHASSDVTATQTTTDGTAPALAHTTGAPSPSQTAADGTAPALAHTTGDAVFGLGESAEQTLHSVVGGDPGITTTTGATDAANVHQTGAPSVTATTTASDAANTHQTFDATVSTAVITNADAEATTHTVATGDPAPAVNTPTGATSHAQSTADATTALGGTPGTPTTAHDAQALSAALTTTDSTAPALTHQTQPPAPAMAVPDNTAPALTHTAFDATASTATFVNVNAEAAAHTVAAADLGVTITTTDSGGTTTHQTFDATVTTQANISVNAEAAATAHTTFPATTGTTTQSASTAHTTADPAALLAAFAQAVSVGLSALNATVTTADAPIATIAVDTGLRWAATVDAPYATPQNGVYNATTHSGGRESSTQGASTADPGTTTAVHYVDA